MSPTALDEVDPAEAARGLFLIVTAANAGEVVSVLATGTVVGVLFEVPETGDLPLGIVEARAACRSAGVAVFAPSADDADWLDADGVVLDAGGAVEAVRRKLGPGRLIGARAGISRHRAMVAGEAGADFIAFGDLEHPPGERLEEILAWWSELFVLPSLVLAGPLDEVAAARLGRAGADFLGLALDPAIADPRTAELLAGAFGVEPSR
ncbi:MAG: hypothetical protein R3349_09840 [Geminicoccaceae bacterium]|nr:hypothetical protein [Geminicoccaceae bacterium]